jgi:hypothetical protein
MMNYSLGYKQRGPAAVDAQNVFVYLTYENAVDIDQIEEENQKAAVIVSHTVITSKFAR